MSYLTISFALAGTETVSDSNPFQLSSDHDIQTSAAITTFLHSMFLFHDIADKVHKEIEAVTHGQRLPQVTDRPNLPFTEAVWKEAWRWSPFIPLGECCPRCDRGLNTFAGIPHVNTQDEIVNGYLIPSGTTIHLNYRYRALVSQSILRG